jgi:colanic acid/amylovoran biosynthesis glycosyltransferase
LLQRPAGYDVLHAHFGPVANNFRFVRALWKTPLVVTFHGYDFSAIPRVAGKQVYRRLFQEADAIMAISDYAKTRLEEFGCPAEKLNVLHTVVRLADFPLRVPRREVSEPIHI